MLSNYKFSSLLAEGERVTQGDLATEARLLESQKPVSALNRRSFLSVAGIAAGAGALGLAGCSDNGSVYVPPVNPVSNAPTVVDVLNFALNLEYFEANFYSYIVNGVANPSNGSNAGTITGGAKVAFSNADVMQVAQNLATEESQHVAFLQATIAAIGGTPISCPALNLAPTAGLTVKDDLTFLAVARQVEGVGVSAYIGGAQYLTSSTAALNYAAQILQTEAQHAGALRQLCGKYAVSSPAADSQDTPPPTNLTTATGLFNTTNGLNPVRTTGQVLGIVYGVSTSTTTTPAAGTTKGGFFPNGLNGNIKST